MECCAQNIEDKRNLRRPSFISKPSIGPFTNIMKNQFKPKSLFVIQLAFSKRSSDLSWHQKILRLGSKSPSES